MIQIEKILKSVFFLFCPIVHIPFFFDMDDSLFHPVLFHHLLPPFLNIHHLLHIGCFNKYIYVFKKIGISSDTL